jgi:hypothetical protein
MLRKVLADRLQLIARREIFPLAKVYRTDPEGWLVEEISLNEFSLQFAQVMEG